MGSVDDDYFFPLVIGGDFHIDDFIGVNGSMNSHNISQQDCYLNHCGVSFGNGFINIHTFSQFNESISFNDMDRGVENGGVIVGHCSMNLNTLYQDNGLISLNNSNNSDDIEMNFELNNVDVSCVIGLINSHTISQCNE